MIGLAGNTLSTGMMNMTHHMSNGIMSRRESVLIFLIIRGIYRLKIEFKKMKLYCLFLSE